MQDLNDLFYFSRPLSATLLALALALVVLVALPAIRKKREETFVEED
jgi:TctA family transporter